MANLLPTPVAAVLGIVPAVLDGVRRLPGRAVQLPVIAVSNALSTMDHLRREYDDLAARGERLVARLRGVDLADLADAADGLEDRVEDAVARTPFATAYDRAEDVLEDAADLARQTGARAARTTGRAAERTAGKAERTAERTAEKAADEAERTAEKAADAVQETLPEAEQPKGAPTPKAPEGELTRVDSAASQQVQQTVEQVAAGAGEVLAHDELPLPDYDHMTLGSLRGRMRSLSVEQLVQVRAYEKAHADRLPIVTMLDNRIAKLATDQAATPSGPVSQQPAPEQQEAAKAGGTGSAVSHATTDAPPANPPSQGVPTNPTQPR